MQYTHNLVYNPSVFSKAQSTNERAFCAHELANLFNQTFAASKNSPLGANTYLIGQANEPIYLPADADPSMYFVDTSTAVSDSKAAACTSKLLWLNGKPLSSLPLGNKIFFNRDYFASALHEVAHWCIAGENRRQQVDYGYWYAPDGRNTQQQLSFESVEAKPQAIEWAFSFACNKPFRVSNDNLSLTEHDSSRFEQAVTNQLRQYIIQGFPTRARQFLAVLRCHYNTPKISLAILSNEEECL